MTKLSAAAALAILFCAGFVRAQAPDEEKTQEQRRARFPFWKAVLPGGVYAVRLDLIGGVSLQRYVLDGAARVTEMNITTAGVMQPRFYFIEPLPTAVPVAGGQVMMDQRQAQIAGVARRVNPEDPLWAKVVKTYPTTTHAGTIEYRLETREELEKLYESLERSWMTQRSDTFTIQGAVDPGQAARDSEEDSSAE